MQASRAGTTHSPGDVGALACRGYKHRCNNSCSICWSSFIPPRAFFLLLRRSFDDFLVLSCFDLVFFFLSTPPVGLRAAVACHRSSPSAPYWKKLYHHTAGSTMNTTPPGISFFVDPDDRLSPTSFQADSVSPFGSDPSSRHAFSSLQSSPHIYQSGQAHSDTSEQQLGVTNEGSHPYPVNMSHRYLDLILQSPDIARHRDEACRYLDLTQELWVALYQPRRSSAAQRALTRHLERLYGTLPAGLWQSVLTVRSDPRFESFQGFLVTAVARIPVSQAHSRSGSDASGHWEMLPGASADARSLHPRQARSQPGSRSPTSRGRRNMRGRAPAGYKYFCPEPGCSHRPFRNAGNYLIHLDRFHPDYPEHDPTDKLRLVSSEQDGPDEGLSLAASNPGDSPLHRRRYPSGDIGRAEETTSTIRHDMNLMSIQEFLTVRPVFLQHSLTEPRAPNHHSSRTGFHHNTRATCLMRWTASTTTTWSTAWSLMQDCRLACSKQLCSRTTRSPQPLVDIFRCQHQVMASLRKLGTRHIDVRRFWLPFRLSAIRDNVLVVDHARGTKFPSCG